MKKFIISLLTICAAIGQITAENVNFTAHAPSAVEKFAQFRIEYSLNAQGDNFQAGNINDFNVLMGPSVSQSYSTQIINGKMSSSKTTTFTYILQATKEGTFTIPAATVMSDGKKYTSNSVTIKVLPPDNSTSANSRQTAAASNSSSNDAHQNTVTNVKGSVFMRAIPSKTRVYEQEAVLLTYKLYVKGVNVSGLPVMKFPETQGFISQDIQLPDDKQWVLEHYNGSNYQTITLKQTLLYPQHAGKITIPSGDFEAILRIPNVSRSRRSIFDDFFDTYTEQRKKLKTDPITIDVKALPKNKPAGYANAVGAFNMKSSINTQKLKTNEAITIKVKISGNGNMKLIENPKVNFPADFEVYDPKVTNDFSNTTGGVKGNKIIEYLAIPRYAGTFRIPPIEFSYFDLNSQSYRTLKSEEYNIEVEKGSDNENASVGVSGNITNKETLKLLGNDIRYIHSKDTRLDNKNDFFYGSFGYWISMLLPLLITVALLVIYRKQAKENADIAKSRNKKANKLAKKRLKEAEKHLKANAREKFYDETLKALWGYFADKFNIPVAELTKENIETELTKRHVEASQTQEVMELLSTCEFARYAPTKTEGEMQNIYQRTIDIISTLEDSFKKTR